MRLDLLLDKASRLQRKTRNLSVFALVGIASTLSYALLFNTFHKWLPLSAAVCSLLAYSVCAIGSYLGHRHLSFRSSRSHQIALPRFILVSLMGNLLAFLIAAVLTDFYGFQVLVSTVVICIVIPVCSCILNSNYVFGAKLLEPEKTV
ncbi:MAG: GtrA family protein [Beijerinckiaceae bacterium]